MQGLIRKKGRCVNRDGALLLDCPRFTGREPQHLAQQLMEGEALFLPGNDVKKLHYSTLLRKSFVRGCCG